jgi:hypothetical protein
VVAGLTPSLTSTAVPRSRISVNLSAVRDTVLDEHHVEDVGVETIAPAGTIRDGVRRGNLELGRAADPRAQISLGVGHVDLGRG